VTESHAPIGTHAVSIHSVAAHDATTHGMAAHDVTAHGVTATGVTPGVIATEAIELSVGRIPMIESAAVAESNAGAEVNTASAVNGGVVQDVLAELTPLADTQLDALWVYLQQGPLLWLTATLGAYVLGHALHRWSGGSPLVNSVALAIALLVGLLWFTGTAYSTYFAGAQFVHFLLGPATVLLAVPLYRNFRQVRRLLVPMAGALLAGSITAILSAVAVAAWLGASTETIVSLAPKSATTPIAMGIAEELGGLASLTAVLVILTGILGAMVVTPLLNAFRVKDAAARGFAVGVAAHGIGAARAFQESQLAGTFAGIAMALNALLTALLVPLLLGWF